MNILKEYIALLTGTIDSGVFQNTGNQITDIQIRLEQYERSIEKYIRESVFTTIVFAENSGYPFDVYKFEKMALLYKKDFEYVACPSYVEETVKGGKSYGEARLIEDALKNSELLKDKTVIYKLTGRIFLRNSKEICKTYSKHRNEFIVYDSKKWCFTNIFKFTKEDYLKYWENIYLNCNEKEGRDIEREFFKIIGCGVEKGLDVGSFGVWPYFDGIQGATLEPYSGNVLERVLRTILCKMRCFTYGTIMSRLLKI